jgi:hypothetical protein
MKAHAWPKGQRPDSKPETFHITFDVGIGGHEFSLDWHDAMRFHSLLWKTLSECERHWPTIRPGEHLGITVTEQNNTHWLEVQTTRGMPLADADGTMNISYRHDPNPIDAISQMRERIADEVIEERRKTRGEDERPGEPDR